MTKILTMSSLYTKLRKLGFSQKYIRKNGLPSWWNNELNEKPFAVLEGAGYIAERLNIDLKSLLDTSQEVRFNTSPDTKFKQHNSNNKQHPYVAQALASRIAELIAYGAETNFTSLSTDVKEIRKEILTNSLTVNLNSLLEYCWNKGIIVAYFNHFPDKSKKIAGLIQRQSSCPVIILSSNHKYNARLAFDLAHELGHLALGHLKEGVLIDEKIEFSCNNDEEDQANNFATYLLLGDYNNYLGKKQFKNAPDFSKYVVNNVIPKYNNIEADAVILNYGWHNKDYFPLAMSALKELNSLDNGQKIINQYLADRLDWDRFNDETYEYLEKVLGV